MLEIPSTCNQQLAKTPKSSQSQPPQPRTIAPCMCTYLILLYFKTSCYACIGDFFNAMTDTTLSKKIVLPGII